MKLINLFKGTFNLGLLLLISQVGWAAEEPEEGQSFFDGIQARNIGPWRGGRSTTVVGTTSDPYVYYMGATAGVWKTIDAGATWNNISDDFFKTAPIGAVDVAPSNPNLVIVGTGESAFRGIMSAQGDGIYKSTDAGKTWTHMGLEDSRQIGSIKFHPTNPEIIWVTVQGNAWAPSEGRGIYKTEDGGDNWRLVLATANDTTGALDLKYDASNPSIIYATLWDHQRTAWGNRSGGIGSGIWRSADSGDTWEQVIGRGLPENVGRVGVAPSPAKSGRVWAIIEADEEEAGLYRTEDDGKNWVKINDEQVLRARSWYYMHIFADPVNEDAVYILNAPFFKSIDGGMSFSRVTVPHGDVHGLWINPENPNWWINANDGGANVSFDGGDSWSSQMNQPTAQIYRVNTDNMAPYNVYGAQQDNSTMMLSSRGYDGSIGPNDFERLGGCESGHLAFDPDSPRYVYGGCYLGIIDEFDRQNHTSRSVRAYEELGLGEQAINQVYRMNWNAPIVASRFEPSVIYHGSQYILRTDDRGFNWAEISPDLTRNEADKQGETGYPYTNENIEVYNTIFAIAESAHRADTLWAGTDDGLLHITTDGGSSWNDVTPINVDRGYINMIETSPHDEGTAYVVVDNHKFGDDSPYIYRTTDNGDSWRMIIDGIPDYEFARVVREDPQQSGLLYAGTERGLYVSFNQGDNWQPMQFNLPAVPITDLKVQGNDLVMSTQGRAFWIVDDISPLRQYAQDQQAANLHFYQPSVAYRYAAGNGGNIPPSTGPNPPVGAVFYYSLDADIDFENENLKVEILNAEGEVLRTIEADEDVGNMGGRSEGEVYYLPAQQGINRAVWDLKSNDITAVSGLYQQAAQGDFIRGYTVGPGQYTLRLSLDDEVQEQIVEVRWDPNFEYDELAILSQQSRLEQTYDMLDELYRSVNLLQRIKGQADARIQTSGEHNSMLRGKEAAESLVAAIEEWEILVVNRDRTNSQNVLAYAPKLEFYLSTLMGTIDDAMQGLTEGMERRYGDLETAWTEAMLTRDRVLSVEVTEYNRAVESAIDVPPLD